MSALRSKPRFKIKINSWLVPLLVGVLMLLQLLAPYRGWLMLLVGLGGAWLLAYLWARALSRHLELTRELRFGWAQVGDRLVERFTLSNDSQFNALWVEVRDYSTLPDYQAGRGTGVGRDSAIRWHREAVCTRRGLYTLGPTSLHSGDPFGIYTLTADYPATMPLLVLPPIVPLPAIEVAPGGRTGEGRPRPHALERTVSAAMVREYVSGDSLRWIHWKTTARRGEPYVRLFDNTPTGDWWIVLDVNRYVQVGQGEAATDEHGVILAASLADQGLRWRHSVGLVAHGEQTVWLPPSGGDGQRWEVLRSLALVTRGTRPLEEVLTRMRPVLGRQVSLIIITPDVDTGWVRALVPLIKRGAVPTVLLLDPLAFGGIKDAELLRGVLFDLGVTCYDITPDVLDRPELRPAAETEETRWRILGTGKAIPSRQRADVDWKVLV